jgi:hypothetical protein
VLALVATLRPPVGRITEPEREIVQHALRCHRDGEIFRSLFRDSYLSLPG